MAVYAIVYKSNIIITNLYRLKQNSLFVLNVISHVYVFS